MPKTLTALSLFLVAAMLAGCPGGPVQHQGPATGPAPVTTAPALDAKALTHLADLKPAIAKPVNSPAPTTAAAGFDMKTTLTEAEKDIVERDFSSARSLLDRAVGFEPNNAQRAAGLRQGLHRPA